MYRTTTQMAAVERRYGQPLKQIIKRLVTEKGVSRAAEELGVSKATLGYWLLKCQLTVQRVVLEPGETVRVERAYANGHVEARP